MSDKTILLTPDGKKKLEQELDHLRTNKRQEVAERIQQAKAYGDVSESGEYEDAKNEQAWLEGRIRELENTLSHAQVISQNGNGNGNYAVCSIGSVVTIEDDTGFKETFQLVSTAEADGSSGKISNESPFGAALFGKSKGDKFKVKAPSGELQFTVVAIE